MIDKYICEINSTIGLVGTIVELNSESGHTQELLTAGIIAKVEQKIEKETLIKKVTRRVSGKPSND
jgi:hypothetical protein